MAIKIQEVGGNRGAIGGVAETCNGIVAAGGNIISVSHALFYSKKDRNPFDCEYHFIITYDDRK